MGAHSSIKHYAFLVYKKIVIKIRRQKRYFSVKKIDSFMNMTSKNKRPSNQKITQKMRILYILGIRFLTLCHSLAVQKIWGL
jgi:hypothetical protein